MSQYFKDPRLLMFEQLDRFALVLPNSKKWFYYCRFPEKNSEKCEFLSGLLTKLVNGQIFVTESIQIVSQKKKDLPMIGFEPGLPG